MDEEYNIEEVCKKLDEKNRELAEKLGIDCDKLYATLELGSINLDRSRGIPPRPPVSVYMKRNKKTGEERIIVLK